MPDGAEAMGPGGARLVSDADKKRQSKLKRESMKKKHGEHHHHHHHHHRDSEHKHRDSEHKHRGSEHKHHHHHRESKHEAAKAALDDEDRHDDRRHSGRKQSGQHEPAAEGDAVMEKMMRDRKKRLKGKGMGGHHEKEKVLNHYKEHMHAEHEKVKIAKRSGGGAKPEPGTAAARREPSYKAPERKKALWDASKDTRMRECVYEWKTSAGGICGGSIKHRVVVEEGLPALALRLMDLSKAQVKKLWLEFRQFDSGGHADYRITSEEFFVALDLDPTPFLKMLLDAIVFDWADLDHDHSLSFSEYLLAAMVVCTLSQRQLIYFVFALFDADDDEMLDLKELTTISVAIEASQFGGTNANFLKVCEGLDSHHRLANEAMKFEGFLEAVYRCPHVAYPAQHLQDSFVKKTLGDKTWAKLLAKYDASNTEKSIACVGCLARRAAERTGHTLGPLGSKPNSQMRASSCSPRSSSRGANPSAAASASVLRPRRVSRDFDGGKRGENRHRRWC